MAVPSARENGQIWRIRVATWREEFTRLSDIHREEWQKFIHGKNNQHAVRNSKDDVAEILRLWEAAGCPDREEVI